MLLSDMVSTEKENTLQHQQQHISHKVGVYFPIFLSKQSLIPVFYACVFSVTM